MTLIRLEETSYKGTECNNPLETPTLSLDYKDYQEFLDKALMGMSTFLQTKMDIIASELNSLKLRYNIQSLTKEDSPVERIVRLLISYGFNKGVDFTDFKILKIISQESDKDIYNGYPLK